MWMMSASGYHPGDALTDGSPSTLMTPTRQHQEPLGRHEGLHARYREGVLHGSEGGGVSGKYSQDPPAHLIDTVPVLLRSSCVPAEHRDISYPGCLGPNRGRDERATSAAGLMPARVRAGTLTIRCECRRTRGGGGSVA